MVFVLILGFFPAVLALWTSDTLTLLKKSAVSGDILVDAVVRDSNRFVVACTSSGYSVL